MEALKQVAPAVRRVAVIYNPVAAPQLGLLKSIETAAESLGVPVTAAAPPRRQMNSRRDAGNEP